MPRPGIIQRGWTGILRLWGWLPIPKSLRWMTMWTINQKFLVGVAAVVLNERGEVLLFKHTYRDKTPWGLPGGWLQHGEDPARAVEREVREESGMRVSVEGPLWVGSDRRAARVDLIFAARYISGEFNACPEVCEAGFFTLDHLPRLLPGTDHLIALALVKGAGVPAATP